MSTLRDTLTTLAGLNHQALRHELDTLEAVRDWAMEQLGVDYRIGDTVVITDDTPSGVPRDNGWYPYREALAPGRTGTVRDITFSTTRKRWYADVAMTHTWSVHERDHHGRDGLTHTHTRYWNGPADETPDGHEPPSAYDQEHHPNGKTKLFFMNVTWLAKANGRTAP